MKPGIAGVVINGAARDRETMSDWGFPVFAFGLSSREPPSANPTAWARTSFAPVRRSAPATSSLATASFVTMNWRKKC